jgi:hypothetical protein
VNRIAERQDDGVGDKSILPMNLFDFVICFAATVAAVTGFRSGLLRGLAMIIGYLSAMPIAVAATSLVTPAFAVQATAPWNSNSMFFFAAFLITGTILGSLLRMPWVKSSGNASRSATVLRAPCSGFSASVLSPSRWF